MGKARVMFNAVFLNTQNEDATAPTKNHMQSDVYFAAIYDRAYFPLTVSVSQAFGTDFATQPPEVKPVKGDCPWTFSHDELSEAAETYYRECVDGIGDLT